MSEWIGVYGHSQEAIDWMKDNYHQANARFNELHQPAEPNPHGIRECRLP